MMAVAARSWPLIADGPSRALQLRSRSAQTECCWKGTLGTLPQWPPLRCLIPLASNSNRRRVLCAPPRAGTWSLVLAGNEPHTAWRAYFPGVYRMLSTAAASRFRQSEPGMPNHTADVTRRPNVVKIPTTFGAWAWGAFVIGMLLLPVGSCGCQNHSSSPTNPASPNNAPVIDSLFATPDSIGTSDSTVVFCKARDADGDSLVYDWETDARLNIQGTPTWNKYVNQTHSPAHTFYNANLPNPISDSAWVYCEVRDLRGGSDVRTVFIILR
jgi:hypothetical protein